jgi:hypothetical protein
MLRGTVTRVTAGALCLAGAVTGASAAARVWVVWGGAELQAAIVMTAASAQAIGSRCVVLLTCMRCLRSRGGRIEPGGQNRRIPLAGLPPRLSAQMKVT